MLLQAKGQQMHRDYQAQHRVAMRQATRLESSMAAHATSPLLMTSAKHAAMAGYVAGVTGVLFGHPLDSIKVWVQTNSLGSNRYLQAPTPNSAPPSTTVAAAAAKMAQHPSRACMSTMASTSPAPTTTTTGSVPRLNFSLVRALYSGASGPLVTVGIVQSINFTCYDAIRRTMHQKRHPDARPGEYLYSDDLRDVATAGALAGSVLATVTAPLILVKTRQQLTGQSLRHAARETVATFAARPRLLAHGFAPHCASEVMGRALYYSTYECVKRTWMRAQEDGALSVPQRMASAGLSGVACWAFIFPLDLLRSRMYHQLVTTTDVRSTWEMAKYILREQGQPSLRNFYRGFTVTVLRSGPVAACVLPIYDLTLEWLRANDA